MRLAVPIVLAACLLPASLAGQETDRRVRVYVDYIAGTSLYVSAGQAQGLYAADTVLAYREDAAAAVGRLLIVSSTRARAVTTFAGDTFRIARGDVLLLEIGASAIARLEASRARSDTTRSFVPPPALPQSRPERAGRAARVSGRVGLDLDAYQTTTRWGSEPEQHSDITYTTPAFRLHIVATDLPGHLRLTSNLRASYYSSSGSADRHLALQAYEASIQSDFGGSPVRLQAGRFYNPFESHSGYWDGALIRLGSRNAGAGIVAGYEPALANQAFSTLAPKTTLFVDVHRRTRSLRYDGDVSIHRHRSQLLGFRREFAGFSQRLSVGRAYFTQRLQLGRDSAGRLEMWQMQLTASTAVAGPLQVYGRYSSERNDLYFNPAPGERVRRTVGISATGRVGRASLEAGDVDSGTGEVGRTGSASFALPRAVAGLGVSLAGGRWEDERFSSTFATATLDRDLGRVHARSDFRYYRTNFGGRLFEQRGAELTLAVPLPDRSEVTITAGTNRGDNSHSNRVLLSLWKSF